MENLYFGFEILVIGFLIVFLTLLLLAFVLMGFNRLFSPQKKAEKEVENARTQTAAAVSTNEGSPGVKPEIIAAAMGALLYAMDTQAYRNNGTTIIQTPDQPKNMWGQAGRTRLLHLRQDFVLMRRGNLR